MSSLNLPLGPENPKDAPYTTRIDGISGGGKTYISLKTLEAEIARGLSPYSFFYVNFGKAAATDVAKRVCKKNGDVPIPAVEEVIKEAANEDGVEKPFRTFNSLALAAAKDAGAIRTDPTIITANDPCTCGASNGAQCDCNGHGEPAGEWWYQHFFRSEFPGIEFSAQEPDPLRVAMEGDDTSRVMVGNQLMAMYQYVQSMGWTTDVLSPGESGLRYHQADKVPVEVDEHHSDITEILEAWEDYKEAHGLTEHNDYMVAAVDAEASIPPVDVLFVDEFQDLSPLMYLLFEQWSQACERVYLAGDGLQSIMGFRGCTPEYFNDHHVDEELKIRESRRSGQNILNAAETVLKPVAPDIELSQHAESNASRGVLHDVHVGHGSDSTVAQLVEGLVDRHVDGDKDSVMVLSREVRGVGRIAHGLRKMGIPYSDVQSDGGRLFRWDDPMPAFLKLARAFRDQARVDTRTVWRTLSHSKLEALPSDGRSMKREFAAMDPDDIQAEYDADEMAFTTYSAFFSKSRSALGFVEGFDLSSWQQQMIKDVLVNGTCINPGDVRVGTIHSSKGLEADAVLLDAAYTKNLRDEFERDAKTEAEERRLYYVGLTRAQDEVLALHGYRGSTEYPLLEDGVENLGSNRDGASGRPMLAGD